jgi:large subunit ribosomal protein L25
MKYMAKGNLKAEKREIKEKRDGFIPAVLYGQKVDNQNLWVDVKEFTNAYKIAGGSTLVDVTIGKDKKSVLIYDVQIHPLTGDFVHVDFFQVDMKKEIETDIELVFTGIAPAVKELGGTFVKSISKLPVRCLPGDLVNNIEVDISSIETFDDYIYVKDLNIPEGLEVTLEDNVVIALTTAPRTAAEMEALDEEVDGDISQVEGMEETAEGEEGDKAEDAGDNSEATSKADATDQQTEKTDKK